MKKAILILLLVNCFFSIAFGIDYYSDSNNSDPNDLSNWWTNTNNTGSNPTSFTGGSDVFYIQSGHSYTTDGDWTLNDLIVEGTLSIGAHTVDVAENVAGAGAITFTAAGTLKIGESFSNTGAFTPSTSTVEYYGSVTDVDAKACTYYNFTLNKPGTDDLDFHGGTIDIDGELNILGGELDIRSEDTTGVKGAVVNVTGKTTISGGGILFEQYKGKIATNIANAPEINMNELELSGGRLGSYIAGIATCTSLSVTGTGSKINRVSLTVSGTTTITGEVDISHIDGTKIFEGDVTVAEGGTWTSLVDEEVTFNSNLIVNGTFNAPTGTCKFEGATASISGTAANVIMPNVSVSGTCTNNASTFSIKGSLSGAGAFINAANCTLEIGDDSDDIGTLTATAVPNTVIYNAPEEIGTQSIKPTIYYNLVVDCIDNTKKIELQDANTTVTNHLDIRSGYVELNYRSRQLIGTGANLTMAVGTKLRLKTKAEAANPAVTVPQFTGTYSLAAGSTIEFYDNNTQNIYGASYANVIFSNSSSKKELQGNFDVNGDLTFSNSVQLDVSEDDFSINIAGDWINNSTNSTPLNAQEGTVTFDGSAAQEISGSELTTFYNLTKANSGNTLTLQTDIDVDNSLELNGNLNINGKTISLSSTASLTENPGYLTGTSGQIQTTRDLNNINDLDVAGLGAKITTTANMGSTSIIRGFSAISTSINRTYQITPTINTGLNATLVFSYRDDELNGNTEDDNLKLKKSPNGNDNWTTQDATEVDGTNNTLTLSGIAGFSYWTAADHEMDAAATTFSGTGNWSTGTWSSGLPGTATDVTISGTCTVDGDYEVKSVDITAGSALTVATGDTLTASDGLTINSDATNSGSLIVNGALTLTSGNVTYNRYMTGSTDPWIWHLISSPVGGQALNTAFMSPNSIATNGTKHGLAPYNNNTPGWAHYSTESDPSTTFIEGQGYEIARTEAGAVAFTGTVATDTIGIDISVGSNSWNLVGNPFPSAVCANTPAQASNNLISVNTAVLDAGEYQAIYIWDADAGTPAYITVNQTSAATYIAPGQAFFVYSATGGGTFYFTEDMQTHQTGDIFKSGTIASPAIKLFAERSEGTSSTNIKYFEGTSTGLDPGYDAGRFSAGDNSFAVYTHLVGDETNLVDFDIQCLPSNEYDHIVPVGLNAPSNTEVVFSAQTENLPGDVPVYLEDKLTGTFTALHESGSFYAVSITEKSEGIGRFYLHTKSLATGISMLEESAFTIIPRPQNNSIRIIGKADNNTQVAIYDIAGRQLSNSRLINPETNDVTMTGLRSGVYIVAISSSSQQISKKISWVKAN